jgi:hypothetical protein
MMGTAGEHAEMANPPDNSMSRTDHFDIGLFANAHWPGGVLMTGGFIDPAEAHRSLLIGSDRS